MKRVSLISALVCAVLLTGCDGTSDPAAPPPEPLNPINPTTPSPSGNHSIAGFVIDASESCIVGARVEVTDGPHKGDSFVQTKCGFWDYGEDIGYVFNGLPEKPVTLRATADGYKPAGITGMPTNPYQYTTYIVLTKNH